MWGIGRPGRSFLERPPAPAAVPGRGTTASAASCGLLNLLNMPCMPPPLEAPVCVVTSAASAALVVVDCSFGSLAKGSIAGLQGLCRLIARQGCDKDLALDWLTLTAASV